MKVQAENIRKRYGRTEVLAGVNFTLGPGVSGLLGPNGAGKSTLIKILATVLPATGGTVDYDGARLPGSEAQVRRALGYVPQLYRLYDRMTGQEFLEYAAAMKGVPRGSVGQEATRVLAAVNLTDAARRRIRAYSGGMRQRLAVAQAFMGRPSLLVLDEPSAGLDPEERSRLKTLIGSHAAEGTVLLSTHIVEDLEDLADHIMVMHGGRMVATGRPADIAGAAAGRVYEVRVSQDGWAALDQTWTRSPGAERPVVVSAATHGGAVHARLITPDGAPPVADASPAGPTLQDGYLALVRYGTGKAS